MKSEHPREVVAGVIRRDGLILICQRASSDRYPLKWEFPGGKVEAGESPGEALARELHEELAIRATIGREISRCRYQYPGRAPIVLLFLDVAQFEGEPRNVIFERIQWEHPGRLSEYDFLEGDREFVARLASGDF